MAFETLALVMATFLFSPRRVLEWLKVRLVWLDRTVGVLLLALAARLALSIR